MCWGRGGGGRAIFSVQLKGVYLKTWGGGSGSGGNESYLHFIFQRYAVQLKNRKWL